MNAVAPPIGDAVETVGKLLIELHRHRLKPTQQQTDLADADFEALTRLAVAAADFPFALEAYFTVAAQLMLARDAAEGHERLVATRMKLRRLLAEVISLQKPGATK